MSTAEPWTVGRLLQWTTDYLKSHGAESARLDAEVLLAHALGRRRIELYTAFEEAPGDAAELARVDGHRAAGLGGAFCTRTWATRRPSTARTANR